MHRSSSRSPVELESLERISGIKFNEGFEAALEPGNSEDAPECHECRVKSDVGLLGHCLQSAPRGRASDVSDWQVSFEAKHEAQHGRRWTSAQLVTSLTRASQPDVPVRPRESACSALLIASSRDTMSRIASSLVGLAVLLASGCATLMPRA